jgi:hypothetical protein
MTNVTVTNKDFSYAVKFLKKNGYTFDARTKTWAGSKDIGFLVEQGYVTVPANEWAAKAGIAT